MIDRSACTYTKRYDLNLVRWLNHSWFDSTVGEIRELFYILSGLHRFTQTQIFMCCKFITVGFGTVLVHVIVFLFVDNNLSYIVMEFPERTFFYSIKIFHSKTGEKWKVLIEIETNKSIHTHLFLIRSQTMIWNNKITYTTFGTFQTWKYLNGHVIGSFVQSYVMNMW